MFFFFHCNPYWSLKMKYAKSLDINNENDKLCSYHFLATENSIWYWYLRYIYSNSVTESNIHYSAKSRIVTLSNCWKPGEVLNASPFRNLYLHVATLVRTGSLSSFRFTLAAKSFHLCHFFVVRYITVNSGYSEVPRDQNFLSIHPDYHYIDTPVIVIYF